MILRILEDSGRFSIGKPARRLHFETGRPAQRLHFLLNHIGKSPIFCYHRKTTHGNCAQFFGRNKFRWIPLEKASFDHRSHQTHPHDSTLSSVEKSKGVVNVILYYFSQSRGRFSFATSGSAFPDS